MADRGFLHQHRAQHEARPGLAELSEITDLTERSRVLGYQFDLLRTAVIRMEALNAGHAKTAFNRRRSDPIAAHVLALLFAQPNPDFVAPPPAHLVRGHDWRTVSGDQWTNAWQVKVATRIWTAGPENTDLGQLLFRLEQHVHDNRHADGWTLREQLTTSIDPGLHADAVWVGLAVSSLDTKTGTFAQVCHTADNWAYVPGVIRLCVNVAPPMYRPHLAWIVGDRRGVDEFGTKTVHSTHRLSDIDFNRPFNYGHASADQLFHDRAHDTALQRMLGLDTALRSAYHFARPAGRPAYGTLWREAAHTSEWRPS
jgi:hypothetical protein